MCVGRQLGSCAVSLVVAVCLFSICIRFAWSETAEHTVLKASCGQEDRTESVQGETSLAERFMPGRSRAYKCNLELVGQFPGEGAAGFASAYKDCVFYSTWTNPQLRHPGVTVLDLSNPRQPVATAYLDSPVMRNANESLLVDPTRGLLFANRFGSTAFDVYDLSECRHPVLKNSVTVSGGTMHTGGLSPNGRTLYTTACCSGMGTFSLDPSVPPFAAFAIDASDTAKLHVIATWIPPQSDWFVHSLTLNGDGSRAYASISSDSGSVLAILDVGDIQERRPDAQFKMISHVSWNDSNGQEFALPIEIQGRPYVVTTDILGAILIPMGSGKRQPAKTTCAAGKLGWGVERIVDISDERSPKLISKVVLEVAAPENCAKVMYDPTIAF